MDNQISIKEAQKLVDDWIHKYGVRYFSELTNMACLTEEVGELARIMARTYGDQSFKQGEKHNIGRRNGRYFMGFNMFSQSNWCRSNRGIAKKFSTKKQDEIKTDTSKTRS